MILNDEVAEQERFRLRSKDKQSKHLIEKLTSDLKRHQNNHINDLVKHATTKSKVSALRF